MMAHCSQLPAVRNILTNETYLNCKAHSRKKIRFITVRFLLASLVEFILVSEDKLNLYICFALYIITRNDCTLRTNASKSFLN